MDQVEDCPVEVFTPQRRAETPGAILFLQGYHRERISDHVGFTQAFARQGFPVVCPSVDRCWWLDRPGQEFASATSPMQFLIDTLVPWMTEKWQVAPPSIALLGVSAGGQGVLQLAYRHALSFPVVAAISPAIDFDRIYGQGFGIETLFPDSEAARQATAILNLHPLNWPRYQFFSGDPLDPIWHDGAVRLSSKLGSSGIPHTCDLTTSGDGHGWKYFNLMANRAVGFIGDSLLDLQRRQ